MRLTTLAIAFTLAPAAFAQTYLAADGDCGTTTLHVISEGNTVAADRVANALLHVTKEKMPLTPDEGAGPLAFHVSVPEEGVAMVAVDFKPTFNGSETRTEHAKAMIFCGPVTPPADWQRSTGLGLEIYPQGWNGPRPHMKAGDSMRFIAVDKATNKLIRDLPMELYRAGGARIAEGVPAQYGGMTFPYQEPGRYVVVTTYRRPDPQQPESFLVDTSTLTFDIK
jgi:hypothetical protein